MASILAEVGTFTSPASTGNQTVSLDTGIWGGASPKCVIFWNAMGADGVSTDLSMSFGIAVSSGSQASVTAYSQNGQATSKCYRRHSNTACIEVLNVSAVYRSAAFVSHGANQFTVNWTTAVAGSYVNYLALGGDDLQVYLDEITSPTSTGNVAYTGVGFQPDALVAFGIGHATSPPDTTNYGVFRVSVSDGSTSHDSHVVHDDGVSTSNTLRSQKGNFIEWFGTNKSVLDLSTVSSLDADGYTLNWSSADAFQRYSWVLCIKAPSVAVITDTQNTSTGTKSTATGVGVPKVALLTHFMGAASASVEDDARIGIGALDASGNQASAGAMDEDAQTTTDADRYQDSNEVIQSYDHTQTLKAAATGTLKGNTELELNWTTADATAREWGALVIGESLDAANMMVGCSF